VHQRLARFAMLFIDEGALDHGLPDLSQSANLRPMYRNTHRSTALRALSDVLEYGGKARSQDQETATLGGLMQHAHILQRLQDALMSVLPPNMAKSCRVANLTADTVTVLCNHPSLGARLRQTGPSLIEAWRNAGFACSALEVRIRPGLPEDKEAPAFYREPLSTSVVASLSELENEISDEGLKAALARLRQSARSD